MAAIRLGRLPDRNPVKISIMVSPELNEALAAYASAYEEAYGIAEAASDLIPAMLVAFLDSDRAFAKMRKALKATDG